MLKCKTVLSGIQPIVLAAMRSEVALLPVALVLGFMFAYTFQFFKLLAIQCFSVRPYVVSCRHLPPALEVISLWSGPPLILLL